MAQHTPSTHYLPTSPLDEEPDVPGGAGAHAQRELFGALMSGFADDEQDSLRRLMLDNIERLRTDGDSYAP
jgi:hypothetical protein